MVLYVCTVVNNKFCEVELHALSYLVIQIDFCSVVDHSYVVATDTNS